jgi:hypothetical protein
MRRELARWRVLSRPRLAIRGLGVIYLVAFGSLRRQVRGLYGAQGILPAREYLAAIAAALPEGEPRRPRPSRAVWAARLRAAPSLLWFDASDRGLGRLCTAGEVAAGAMVLGVGGRLPAAICWATYLSFFTVGREFLRFQWDVLLLEAGAQAMLGRPRRLLMRLLAVRLQLESGLAKLASHDPTWRDLSACCHHQETQPLPTPLGWYAHHLPAAVQRFATALTLTVECAAPALAFGPRRLRRWAFGVLTGFQGLIALTGNYAFFNWLTAVLNLAIVEQRPAKSTSRRVKKQTRKGSARGRHAWRLFAGLAAGLVDLVAGATLAVLGVADLTDSLQLQDRVPPRVWVALDRLARTLSPLRLVGSYGLFSTMTTTRPEVVVEGSSDGESWREYTFRYKPGDVRRRPRWVAPHQPRLDWQMWFAALGAPPRWFLRFLGRLLEGAPDVLALLAGNPFPDRPPRFVRAVLYEYRVADLATRRRTGVYWSRRRMGLYVPALEARPRPAAVTPAPLWT